MFRLVKRSGRMPFDRGEWRGIRLMSLVLVGCVLNLIVKTSAKSIKRTIFMVTKLTVKSIFKNMIHEEIKAEKRPVFKVASFQHTSKSSNKKRAWKSLKQILTAERALPWPEDYVHYSSINAPPTFKPVKKYSDISGLSAPYTDPQTHLRYSNVEEYATVISLPMDITAGYLALRGASSIVG